MDYLEKLVAKKAEVRRGKQLPHEIPEFIKREDFESHTIDTMEHFGLQAASLLNTYSCALEDALIEQVKKGRKYADQIVFLYQEVMELRELLPEDVLEKFDSEVAKRREVGVE